MIFLPQFGFKTSFFGFKKEEVNAYIGHVMSEHKQAVRLLEAEKTELNKDIEKLKEEYSEIKAKLDYYVGKEAEIEKMSISIGTMYMLAKQNAREIVGEAEKCAKEIADHSKKQLDAAEIADEKLNALKDELAVATERFSGSVAAMSDSFEQIKVRLENELARLEGKPEIELFIENL